MFGLNPRRGLALLIVPAAGLGLTACGGGGGGGGGSAGQFRLVSTNIADGAVWPLNQRITFTFTKPVNPASVSFNTIVVQSASATPVTGSFFVDPCDPKTLVFQPNCPTDATYSTGGLQPNAVTYSLSLVSGSGPNVLRATDGSRLQEGTSVIFRTPLPPFEPLFADPDPLTAPIPELLSPTNPSPPLPIPLPLNLFSEPAPPLVVSFGQSLDPAPSNVTVDRFVLEFEDPPGSGSFTPIPRTVTLVQNCALSSSNACPRPEEALVTVVPNGILPPGRTIRLVVKAGILDIGQTQALPTDVVAATFAVDAPTPGGDSDAFVEEFVSSENEDPAAAFEVPSADWGDDVLIANEPFPGSASTFDWFVPQNTTILIDTSFDTIVNPTTGEQVPVVNGVANVRNLFVSLGGRIQGQGPNPLVINASGRITVAGIINVDGFDAINTGGLNTPEQPQSGAPGNCGGGSGGTASLSAISSDIKGENGYGPGNIPNGGGGGGHSCYGVGLAESRRAGGGGGGTFTLQTHTTAFISPQELNGENGGPGPAGIGDCIDFALPVNGGPRGPDVFVDGISNNDFFGRKFQVGNPLIVGELAGLRAGEGGGGGGDAVQYSGTPAPPNCLNNAQWQNGDRKGGAAGGGAGVLVLRAIGPIVVTSSGTLSAKGGSGGHGESILFINPAGGGGGGGSGGMILVESADTSVQDNGDPANPALFPPAPPGTPGGIRIEGTASGTGLRIEVKGGNGGLGADGVYTATAVCRGGEGGGGIAQFHSSRVDGTGAPILRVGTADVTSFATPTIDQAQSAHVLLPNFGPRSRSRSRWIDTGFTALGSLGSATFPWVFSGANDQTNPDYPLSNADASFPGISGMVRRDASGNVALLAPIPASAISIPQASVTANAATLPGAIVPNPATLVNDAFNPNTAQTETFTIVSASFDGTNTTVQTDPAEGSMVAVLGGGSTTPVAIHPRFFRVFSQAAADFYPAAQQLRIQFEGADAVTPAVVGLVGPTANLSEIAGKRFFRFTTDFDLGGSGLSVTTPRPEVRFLKVPIRF